MGTSKVDPGIGYLASAASGAALGLLDQWLSEHNPDAPAGLGKLTRLPAGRWTGERAAADILTLAGKGRAFADTLRSQSFTARVATMAESASETAVRHDGVAVGMGLVVLVLFVSVDLARCLPGRGSLPAG